MADSPATPQPEATQSKAGRNLPVAIAAGVVLGGLCIASLAWQKWLFIPLAVLALWIGITEIAVRTEVITVRDSVWLVDRLISSAIGIFLYLRRFSRMRSKMTTVSLIE